MRPSHPLQVMDFYLSDPVRQQWDNLLTHAETLEDGDFSNREQVVHWVRSFPFAFLSDRSYTIARRQFERDGVLYGISKVVSYPGHDSGRTIRMDNYWSMWSCTPTACPYGSGAPCSLCCRPPRRQQSLCTHTHTLRTVRHAACRPPSRTTLINSSVVRGVAAPPHGVAARPPR